MVYGVQVDFYAHLLLVSEWHSSVHFKAWAQEFNSRRSAKTNGLLESKVCKVLTQSGPVSRWPVDGL